MSDSGHRIPNILVLAVLGLTLFGCGKTDELVLVPVEGQIFQGNNPLTTGSVILRADVAKGNKTTHEPRGQIDEEGKFKIFTTLRPGAPPGWYKVGVVATKSKDPKSYAVPKSLIQVKYNNPDKSGLTLEAIPDAPPGTYDLKLKK